MKAATSDGCYHVFSTDEYICRQSYISNASAIAIIIQDWLFSQNFTEE